MICAQETASIWIRRQTKLLLHFMNEQWQIVMNFLDILHYRCKHFMHDHFNSQQQLHNKMHFKWIYKKRICSFDCNLWSTKLLNQKWYTIFYGFEIDKIKTEFMRQQKKREPNLLIKKKVECNRMMCGGGYTKEWAIELETHFAGRKNKKKKLHVTHLDLRFFNDRKRIRAEENNWFFFVRWF